MRVSCLWRGALAAVLLALSAVSCASPPPPPSAVLNGSSPGLRDLTEEGALFYPDRVGHVLQVQLTSSQRKIFDSTDKCISERPTNIAIEVGNYHAGMPVWLKSAIAGVQPMQIPASATNPGVVPEGLPFTYSGYEVSECNGSREHEESLSISLPGIVCFTRNQLEREYNTRDQIATDGVDLIYYEGSHGALLSFVFRAGEECALIAGIRQVVVSGRD